MTADLHRLVYYSRNRIGGGSDSLSDAIGTILETSRSNNARADVTGALMFNAGCFAQVLEGPRVALENVFERIQQDDRHGDVSLLAFSPARNAHSRAGHGVRRPFGRGRGPLRPDR
jgi:hypothetical protein